MILLKVRSSNCERIWNEYFPGVIPVLKDLAKNNKAEIRLLDPQQPNQQVFFTDRGLNYSVIAGIQSKPSKSSGSSHYLEILVETSRNGSEEGVGKQYRQLNPIMGERLFNSAVTQMLAWVDK